VALRAAAQWVVPTSTRPITRPKFVAPVTRAEAWRGIRTLQTKGSTCCVLDYWAGGVARIMMLAACDQSHVAQATIRFCDW
jgi:hypothetical protein